MGQGKSQARPKDLTLRKNHHTLSQALSGGGAVAPVPPSPEGGKVWGCGGHAGLMGSGAYRSLTFNIMPLLPSVSMQARGREGCLSPSLPLCGGHRGVESGEAMR